MCKIFEDNVHEMVQSSVSLKNLHSLEEIYGDISRILSPSKHHPPASEKPVPSTAAPSQKELQSRAAESISPPNQQPADVTEIEMEDSSRESELKKPAEMDMDLTGYDPLKDSSKIKDLDSGTDPIKKGSKSPCNVSASADASQIDLTGKDVMMEETGNEESGKSEAGVIVLDD